MRIEQTQTVTYETAEEAQACVGLVEARLRSRALRDLRTAVDDRRLRGQEIADFDDLDVTVGPVTVSGNEISVTAITEI